MRDGKGNCKNLFFRSKAYHGEKKNTVYYFNTKATNSRLHDKQALIHVCTSTNNLYELFHGKPMKIIYRQRWIADRLYNSCTNVKKT
jgi:hypothetical protein